MSEIEPGPPLPPGEAGEAQDHEQTSAPRRVIGTPPPAHARILLANPETDAEPPAPRELPDGPDNPAAAKTAERIIAACFILAMLASIGFIAAYVGLEVHSVDATLRSNLALGLSMSVAFLAVGVGVVIWVRNIMPDVEQVEERHTLASSEPEREAFAKTFTDGAAACWARTRPSACPCATRCAAGWCLAAGLGHAARRAGRRRAARWPRSACAGATAA